MDAFLKIPRPDGKDDGLGTTRIDEPTLNPSDATVLDLQLRSISKHQNLLPMEVKSVSSEAEIKTWINKIGGEAGDSCRGGPKRFFIVGLGLVCLAGRAGPGVGRWGMIGSSRSSRGT